MANPTLRPLRAEQFGYWQAHHLLHRAGFGGTPDQVRILAQLGLDRAVAHLVRYQDVPYEEVAADRFRGDIVCEMTDEERLALRRARAAQDEETIDRFERLRMERQRQDRRQIRAMQQWWLKRLIESPRPLEEKMTLFFHGHFATAYRPIENSYHLFLQNQLFRSHATGNFADLCFAIIRDPAMLAYLDNNRSHRRQPNENLARELLELFTLGEGNAYTENDIKEGARALTGYSFSGNEFLFREDWHDPGVKRLLGRSGNFNGDDFVRLILGRNVCSEFIAYKLYRFFVSDLPDGPDRDTRRFIVALGALTRRERYHLAPVLEALFKSEHFYDSSRVGAQIKSPVQLVAGAVRSLRTPVIDLNILVEALDLMGQNLFYPPSVKGWDGGRSWINTSTLFVRHNILTHLLTGRLPTGRAGSVQPHDFDPLPLLSQLSRNGSDEHEPEGVAEFLAKMCFGRDPLPQRKEALLKFLGEHGHRVNRQTVTGMLCLITAMPEYQLC